MHLPMRLRCHDTCCSVKALTKCAGVCASLTSCVTCILCVQILVIFTSMVVVAFVTLLQNPVLGSPTWLPMLLVCWAVAFAVTMVLQASLPLPDIQR